MKILNKISIISVFMMALTLLTASCTDDDKDPLNDTLSTSGGFVRFTEENPPETVGVQDVSDVEYSLRVSDANNNVSTYDLSLYADISGVRTDTIALTQVTSFPSSLTYSIDELTAALGITNDDVSFGDQFFFSSVVTTDEGVVYSGEPLFYGDDEDDGIDGNVLTGQGVTADLLNNAGYRQAFEFDFIILCPEVNFDDLVGTYDVTDLGFDEFFGETDFVRTIVKGPGENQITVVKGAYPVAGGEDLILDIDPVTAAVSLAEPALAFSAEAGAFDTDNYGDDTAGFVFSCIGRVAIVLDFDAFSGNAHAFTLEKRTDSDVGI